MKWVWISPLVLEPQTKNVPNSTQKIGTRAASLRPQPRRYLAQVVVALGAHHRRQPRRHLAQIVVGLGAHQRPEDRAQTEIDAGIGLELFGRQGQRIDGGDDQRTGARVEREIAPLLDQRPRQRFGEQTLGQAERGRLAPAFVAAFEREPWADPKWVLNLVLNPRGLTGQ